MNSLEKSKEIISAIGNLVVDDIKELQTRLDGLFGAILTTADGFNICALGLENDNVGKAASLTSSMFSLTQAITETVLESAKHKQPEGNQEVLITLGDIQIVAVQIKHPTLENLVLLVAAKDTAVGFLLTSVRLVVNKVEKKIATFTTN